MYDCGVCYCSDEAFPVAMRLRRNGRNTDKQDVGFTPSLLADALDYIDALRRHTFDPDDAAYDELVAFAKSTARELQELERERSDQGGLSII